MPEHDCSRSLLTLFQYLDNKYEYLLNEKQSTLDHYIKDLDTDSELAKRDKVKVIEIVQ